MDYVGKFVEMEESLMFSAMMGIESMEMDVHLHARSNKAGTVLEEIQIKEILVLEFPLPAHSGI